MFSRRAFGLSAIGAGLFASTVSAQPAEGPPLPPTLTELATLPLATPDGVATTLGPHLRPGPTVISFWATWCAPCVAEARHLAGIRTRYAPDRLNIIGINVDRRRDETPIADFLRRGQVNYTQMRGDDAVYQAFGGGVPIALPRLFVFAAEGHAIAAFGRYNGGVTLRLIDRAVERALA